MITGIYASNNYIDTSLSGGLAAVIVGIPEVPEEINLASFIYGINAPESSQTSKVSSLFSVGSSYYLTDQNPDLVGNIFAIPLDLVFSEDLNAFIYPKNPPTSGSTEGYIDLFLNGSSYYVGSSLKPDLKAYVLGTLKQDSLGLPAYIRAAIAGFKDVYGFIRPAESGYLDLGAGVLPQSELNLGGAVVPRFSGYTDLLGFIDPIPPVNLNGNIQAIFETDLLASIAPVPPFNLTGDIKGIPFLNLQTTIEGVNTLNLIATYSGFFLEDLNSSVIGIGSGFNDLLASYTGKLGTDIESNLVAKLSGVFSDGVSLSGYYIANEPEDLQGFYDPVLPVDLGAKISEQLPLDLGITLTGVYFPGILRASISGSGDIFDFKVMISAGRQDTLYLSASIDGTGRLGLGGFIESEGVSDLSAVIASDTNAAKDLIGTYSSQDTLQLIGTYEVATTNSLNANITAIEAFKLGARIKPKFYYIESSIPINTYAISNLEAFINADPCDSLSSFQDLTVIITGQTADTLRASVVAVQGQYSISTNKIEFNTTPTTTHLNWQPFILVDPALTYNKLEIQLVTSPFLDLGATITGIPVNFDLTAQITSKYYSIPTIQGGTAPIVNWVNTKTGESKLVSIFFRGPDLSYYYSEEANRTYSLDPFTEMVIVIESYAALENETILSLRTDVKECIIDNLERFETIDDAIRFGIECAVGTYGTNLGAYILGVGGFEDLTAEIDGLINTVDLKSAYNIVTSIPDLSGTISGSGGFGDLTVHLTPVISSATLSGTDTPDLTAVVVGFGMSSLNATISGS